MRFDLGNSISRIVEDTENYIYEPLLQVSDSNISYTNASNSFDYTHLSKGKESWQWQCLMSKRKLQCAKGFGTF